MWYSSPSTSPQSPVSSNDMVANVQADFGPTECVAVAEGPLEPDLASHALPVAPKVMVVAASAGPGTEYWLP